MRPCRTSSRFPGPWARDTLPNVTAAVAAGWPGPVTYHGFEAGSGVMAGACLAGAPAGSPVRRIFELTLGPAGRPADAFDIPALLYAVKGLHGRWNKVGGGRNEIAADGSNQWVPDSDCPQAYLVRLMPVDSLSAELEVLICRPPGP